MSKMSGLGELRAKIDWEKIVAEIVDVIMKSFGLTTLYLWGPIVIPDAFTSAILILSGNTLKLIEIVICTLLLLRFCRWWNNQDNEFARGFKYVMNAMAFLFTAHAFLVAGLLVLRFGIVASILASSAAAVLCVFIYDPNVFSEYLLKPASDEPAHVEPLPKLDTILDEKEDSHYLTLDDLEDKEDT